MVVSQDSPHVGRRRLRSITPTKLSRTWLRRFPAVRNSDRLRFDRPPHRGTTLHSLPIGDVVLLDVKLGNGSGYQVCRDLRELFRDEVSIIFMSGERTDSSDKVAGLLLGADDYITKPFEPDELLARVSRAVARSSGEPSAGGGARLTPREREVLSLLASGEGTKAISARLHISPKTVSTHVQRMLIKLDLHSRAEAVAFAYREGLVEKSPARTVAVPGH
jgi:DNA-binding NarL/FixJ family response regulator